MRSARRVSSLLLVLALGVGTLSCEREPDTAAFFEKTKDCLVEIMLESGKSAEGAAVWREATGFFVSRNGTVLTAAHPLRGVPSMFVAYRSEQGTTGSEYVKVIKTDSQLDLALLVPERPIPPVRFLRIETEREPVPGQRAAVLASLRDRKKSQESWQRVKGVLPTTVLAVLPDGLCPGDIYAYKGICGSPVVDLTTERVVGVCIRLRSLPVRPKGKTLTSHRPDGTTVSLPVYYYMFAYSFMRSTTAARDFLANLP